MLSAIWLLGNRQQAMGSWQLELATGCYLLSPGAVYNFRHCELKSARNRTVTVPRHCVFLLHLNMITNYGQATVQQCSSAEERAQCGAFNTHVVACVQCDSATYGREQATQAVWLFFYDYHDIRVPIVFASTACAHSTLANRLTKHGQANCARAV